MSFEARIARAAAALTCVALALATWSAAQQPPSKATERPSPTETKPDPAEAAILKKLQEPTEYSFAATPLKEVVEYFAKKHQVPMVLNGPKLADLDPFTKTLVTGTAKDIPLELALNRLLAPLDLAWVIRHEVLDITTIDDEQAFQVLRVYGVADLVLPVGSPDSPGPLQPDYESLIDLVTTIVQPASWEQVGGPGSVQAAALALTVRQTQAIHRLVAALLTTLRKSAVLADPLHSPKTVAISCLDDRSAERIMERLRRPVSPALDAVPLEEIARVWSKEQGIEIVFDRRGLGEAGVDATTATASLHAKDISLRSALELVLREHGLRWVVEDGALSITSRERADEKLTVCVYPIADLVPSKGDVFPTPDGDLIEAHDNGDALVDVIQIGVADKTWSTVGGPAELKYFEGASSLVCRQTREGHEQVELLLRNLREHGTRPQRKAKAKPIAAPVEPPLRDDEVVLRSYELPGDGATRSKVAEETAKLIQDLVTPDSWKAKDSAMFVRVWPDRLVVRQTVKGQREVQGVLKELNLLTPPSLPAPPAAPPQDD